MKDKCILCGREMPMSALVPSQMGQEERALHAQGCPLRDDQTCLSKPRDDE